MRVAFVPWLVKPDIIRRYAMVYYQHAGNLSPVLGRVQSTCAGTLLVLVLVGLFLL